MPTTARDDRTHERVRTVAAVAAGAGATALVSVCLLHRPAAVTSTVGLASSASLVMLAALLGRHGSRTTRDGATAALAVQTALHLGVALTACLGEPWLTGTGTASPERGPGQIAWNLLLAAASVGLIRAGDRTVAVRMIGAIVRRRVTGARGIGPVVLSHAPVGSTTRPLRARAGRAVSGCRAPPRGTLAPLPAP